MRRHNIAMRGHLQALVEGALGQREEKLDAHAVDFRPADLGEQGLVHIFDLEARSFRKSAARDECATFREVDDRCFMGIDDCCNHHRNFDFDSIMLTFYLHCSFPQNFLAALTPITAVHSYFCMNW